MEQREWIYQERRSKDPWAICAICTFPRGHPERAAFEFDIYSEKIENEAKRLHLDKEHFESERECYQVLTQAIGTFDEMTIQDEFQLGKFVNKIHHL